MNTTGKILDRFLKDAGLSQAEMAAGVDASQGQVSKWLKDLNTPSPKTWKRIQSFAAKLGYDLPKLSMIDDVNRSGGVVKVLGEVGAGAVVTPFDNGELDTVFLNFRLPEDTYGAVVKGSSMLPVFEDGDLIIFGQNELSPDQAIGDTCIVYTDEGQMLIKIVMRGSSPGLYTLISTNNPPIPDIKLQWARPFEFRVSRKAWKK